MATLSAQVILSLVDKLSAPAERAANSLNQIEQRGQAASSRIKTVAAGALRAIPVAAIVAGTAASARSFAKLETTLEELGIVAGMTDEQIAGMRSGVEKTAPQLGLAAEEAYGVIQSLVQGGMDIDRATQVWPTIAKTARAASADMRDISDAGNAVMSQLGITPDELERAYDAMIEGGKMGRFELKDMAREFPALTAQAQRLGYDGVDGVIKLVAQLQYLRETAGSGSEAANNLRNLMLKVFSAETARNFEKYGIDIMDRLGEAAERGENQLEAVLDVVEEITKGMSDTEAQAVISRLFPDQQAQAGLLGLRRYREEIRQAEKEIAQTSGSVQRDWERMMDTAQGSADKLIANLKRVRNAVGEEVLPAITGVMDSINEVFDAFENRTGGVLEFFRKLRQEGGEPDAIDKAIAGAGDSDQHARAGFLLGVPIDRRERRKFDAMLNMQRERAGTVPRSGCRGTPEH
ncbi:MAG: phage tail tape measure protein [Rhodobiaceae bacterium]|nr:phage tail tape measure protein [Rhodobiaceae bacterium]